MARTAVLGLPRIGADRELKTALEARWAKQLSSDALQEVARQQRAANLLRVSAAGIDVAPVGDFALYDHVLESIEDHRAHLEADGGLGRRREGQMLKWLHALVDEAVLTAFHRRDGVGDALVAAERAVAHAEQTVPQATAVVLEAAGLGDAAGLTRSG